MHLKMKPGWKFKRLIFKKISHAEEIRIWPPKLKWNKIGTVDKWSPAIHSHLKGICIWLPKFGFQREIENDFQSFQSQMKVVQKLH